MFGFGILSGLIVLPLVGAAFILVLRGDDEATPRNARWAALITTLVTFLLSLVAWGRFDPGTADFQLIEAKALVRLAASATSSASTASRCPSCC